MSGSEEPRRTPHPSSVVIIDPSNRENITGTVSLAFAWGEQFSPPEQYLRGFIHLQDAMTRWTRIETTIDRHLMISSPRIMDMPFLYIAADENVEVSETEKENLGKYLESGGFLVIENANPLIESGPGEASLKRMVLESLGHNVRFQPIPNDHPLYHCFFDFPNGPPSGSEYSAADGLTITRTTPYLEGVWIGERLAVVFSGRGYIINWTQEENNIPQLKMGVNMIVFSLIQEGGIALRR